MNKYLIVMLTGAFAALTYQFGIGYVAYIPIVFFIATNNIKNLAIIVPMSLASVYFLQKEGFWLLVALYALVIIHAMLLKKKENKKIDLIYIFSTAFVLNVVDNIDFKSPCYMCAKMRRGALHDAMKAKGINKIALGHHYDDAVETFLLSLFYEGRLSCFQPVTDLDRTGIIQIRPMLYIHEKTVDNFAVRKGLPILENRCPVDKTTKRTEVKELVYSLSQTYPDLKERIFGAMQRYPLPEWEPRGRYKRPKDQE